MPKGIGVSIMNPNSFLVPFPTTHLYFRSTTQSWISSWSSSFTLTHSVPLSELPSPLKEHNHSLIQVTHFCPEIFYQCNLHGEKGVLWHDNPVSFILGMSLRNPFLHLIYLVLSWYFEIYRFKRLKEPGDWISGSLKLVTRRYRDMVSLLRKVTSFNVYDDGS